MMASSSTWTVAQNKRFENAVAMLDKDTAAADYWEKVAMAVGGGKTVEDVKMHYNKLVQDVTMIEQDLIPLPNYTDTTATATAKSKGCKAQHKRMKKNVSLQ